MSEVSPIPEGYHTVTPYIIVRGAAEAIEFYGKAFGAEECFRMDAPGGVIAHAEIKIGDSVVMLGDENPGMGATAPPTVGGTATSLLLYVEDVDAAFAQATDAGCKELAPPTDMFWGDRFCKVSDPFGHAWAIATHVEDVPPEEMGKRAEAAFAEMGG